MQVPELLRKLELRGAVVSSNGTSIMVNPARVLDDELREELRRLKPALLAVLTEQNTTAVTTVSSAAPAFRNEPATALERLEEASAMCRVPWCSGLVKISPQLLRLWSEAEKETGQKLTIMGRPRVEKSRPFAYLDDEEAEQTAVVRAALAC